MCLEFYWILNISLFSVREQGLFLQGRSEFYVECLSTTYVYIMEKNIGVYLAFSSGDTIKKYTYSCYVLIGVVLAFNKITFYLGHFSS